MKAKKKMERFWLGARGSVTQDKQTNVEVSSSSFRKLDCSLQSDDVDEVDFFMLVHFPYAS